MLRLNKSNNFAEEMITEKHPFDPFLPAGAQILVLGSFPPPEHRWSMPFYYPNWINDFWRIMGLIHFGDKNHFCDTPRKRFDEDAIRTFCAQKGFAFYDTACEVRRLKDNASDAFLEVIAPTDLKKLLRKIPDCLAIVTTGQKASELAAKQLACDVPPVGSFVDISFNDGSGMRAIRFWRMPSSSRAYPLPLDRKADAYRQLFE